MNCDAFMAATGVTFSCCTSCHEDEDYGYANDFETLSHNGRDFTICCAGSREPETEIVRAARPADTKELK